MKFMITWNIHRDKRLEVLKHWCNLTPEERAYLGEDIRLIGRWHNEAEFTGVAIMETDDCKALYGYLMQWNPYMDLDIAPVLDDEESAAVGRSVLQAQEEE